VEGVAHLGSGLAHGSMQSAAGGGDGTGGSALAAAATIMPSPQSRANAAATMRILTVAPRSRFRPARCRSRPGSSRWQTRDSRTEEAQPRELAPLIADAYGFSDRERRVTELVAQGLPTNDIGQRLHVSTYTVHDHLKSIFDKTGAGSQGELVARLFFDHYAPRLQTTEPH
jgi:DNA-binding NarL/FixJ family response regulator